MADLPVRPLVSRLYMADAFGESRLRRYMFTPESTFFASESAIYRRNVSCQSSKSAIHKADTLKNGLIVVWPESGAQSETKRASRFIPPFSVDVMARWRYLAVTRRNVFKTRAAFHTVLSAPYDGAGNVNSKRKKEEGDMGQLDSGNAAWILTSASLVFLMTPGVAFFYGGMVRAKAVLNMMIMEAAALSVTMVIWVLWGWSIAYAGTSVGGVFGDPATGFLLKDSMVSDGGVFTSASLNSNNYPVSVDVAFQSAFAMITVALICGAIAERVKYSTWMIFVALWITFDYAPLGKRKGFGTQPFRPHNVPFVMLGAFLLWFGWFGFNAGSAFAANGTAGYAWVSTSAATAAAMLSWGFTEKIRTGHYTAMGAASGIVAGLVAITPAADVVSPLWAIVLGAIAGVLTCLACGLKFKLGYDDSLDVVGVHGVGGFTGTVLIGFFGEGTGLFAGGDWKQLVVQLIVALVAIIWSAVVTGIIAFALEKTIGWRVTEAQEVGGIDLADQGERAYDFAGTASSVLKEVK